MPHDLFLHSICQNNWQPGGLGSFVALEPHGGSEDPWLCVPDFCQVCLCPLSNMLLNGGLKSWKSRIDHMGKNKRKYFDKTWLGIWEK